MELGFTRKETLSLTFKNANGDSEEVLILWKFIREPQEEVLAHIKGALEGVSR